MSPQRVIIDTPSEVVGAPKPSSINSRTDVATIEINGQRYEDWETVTVQQRYGEDSHVFDFTCTDKLPGANITAIQVLKPGDLCTVLLGGQLAVTGEIIVRQSATNEDNHGVQLVGKGRSWLAAKSSIDPKKSNFDGYTWEQIAHSALSQCGVKLETVGKLSDLKFKNCQAQPGETAWQFLERLARNRGVVLGSNNVGSILGIGDHEVPISGQLIEGENIKSDKAVFTNEFVHNRYQAAGSQHGSDEHWGAAASEIDAQVGGSLKNPSLSYTPMEQGGSVQEAELRARFEAQWHESTTLEAQVTVQGWLRKNGQLWKAGEGVWLRAPTHFLDLAMMIQQATFTQSDAQGTLTTLDLVLPWKFNGKINYDPNQKPFIPNNTEG